MPCMMHVFSTELILLLAEHLIFCKHTNRGTDLNAHTPATGDIKRWERWKKALFKITTFASHYHLRNWGISRIYSECGNRLLVFLCRRHSSLVFRSRCAPRAEIYPARCFYDRTTLILTRLVPYIFSRVFYFPGLGSAFVVPRERQKHSRRRNFISSCFLLTAFHPLATSLLSEGLDC